MCFITSNSAVTKAVITEHWQSDSYSNLLYVYFYYRYKGFVLACFVVYTMT